MVKLSGVTKKYGTKLVLNKVSLTISEGDSVALVGNNGSGKSTLMKIISNITGYDNGEVRVFGKKVEPGNSNMKTDMGILLHDPYLLEDFNAVEYFEFLLRFRGLKVRDYRQRLEKLIELFEFTETKSVLSDLSAGNRRKVSLIGVFLHKPKLVLLDEPFINLDIRTTNILKRYLLREHQETTVLITSHQLAHVLDVSEKVLVLDGGEIARECSTQVREICEETVMSILDKTKK